jgi:hypothetical protein
MRSCVAACRIRKSPVSRNTLVESEARHDGPSRRAAALIVEAQASPRELGDGMLWEPCPVSARPCPCLILARARRPFRLAAMASSACIASSQAAPAMPAAASGAPLMPAQSVRAHASAFPFFLSPLSLSEPSCQRGAASPGRTQWATRYASPTRKPVMYFSCTHAAVRSRPAGICVACKICAANSHPTPTKSKPSELGIDRREPRSRGTRQQPQRTVSAYRT